MAIAGEGRGVETVEEETKPSSREAAATRLARSQKQGVERMRRVQGSDAVEELQGLAEPRQSRPADVEFMKQREGRGRQGEVVEALPSAGHEGVQPMGGRRGEEGGTPELRTM